EQSQAMRCQTLRERVVAAMRLRKTVQQQHRAATCVTLFGHIESQAVSGIDLPLTPACLLRRARSSALCAGRRFARLRAPGPITDSVRQQETEAPARGSSQSDRRVRSRSVRALESVRVKRIVSTTMRSVMMAEPSSEVGGSDHAPG